MQAFHTVPPKGDGRRLLLISYHFPPAQTAGALRWQRLSRYAAERGWALDVVTVDPASLERGADPGRLDELPRGTRVYGVEPGEPWLDAVERRLWGAYRAVRPAPASGASAGGSGPAPGSARPESLGRDEMEGLPRSPRDAVRAWHAWREHARDGLWARRAAEVAEALGRSERYDAVISCGPPHMAHVGARRAARRLGVPLVVDMRDPWSLVQRLPESVASGVWLRLARRYERMVVADAALVVANTEPAAEALRATHPEAADRVIAVLNGYDDDPLPRAPERDRFTIAYAGTIYLDRDPSVLFRAAARVIDELGLGPDEFGIELMGHVRSFNGQPVDRIAAEHGLDGFIRVHPPGPRSAAMEFLSSAHLLVSLPQDSDLAIPSKVYEYLRHDAWVLALAGEESATGRLLRATEADVAGPGDVEAIAGILRRRFLEYRDGVRPEPLAEDRRLSREHQASILFDALEERLVSGPLPLATRR